MAREKRKKRKEREKRAKYQRRIDLKMVNPEDVLETAEEMGLFSIRRIKNSGTLSAMEDGTEQADRLCDSDAESSSEEEASEEEIDSELDDSDLEDVDRRRIENEREFEALYNDYLARTGQVKKRERKGKKAKKPREGEGVSGTCVRLSCEYFVSL